MIDVLQALLKLDMALVVPEEITLGGSAVPILAGCGFRATADVDFAAMPSEGLRTIISRDPALNGIFDVHAPGVMGLLYDYEDRNVRVDMPYVHLTVYRLSLMDWVVSKLTSPKIDDVLNIKEVTLDMLKDIRRQMHKYAGVGEIRAANDLEYLISEKEKTIQ